MKLKKLNKKQKDLLKKSLLKGLNITCYVVTGLTLLLGTIIGLKSCSSNNKTQSVATTPVVTDVLNEKRFINDVELGLDTSAPETRLYVDYASYFYDTRYEINGDDYNLGDLDSGLYEYNYGQFDLFNASEPIAHVTGWINYDRQSQEPEDNIVLDFNLYAWSFIGQVNNHIAFRLYGYDENQNLVNYYFDNGDLYTYGGYQLTLDFFNLSNRPLLYQGGIDIYLMDGTNVPLAQSVNSVLSVLDLFNATYEHNKIVSNTDKILLGYVSPYALYTRSNLGNILGDEINARGQVSGRGSLQTTINQNVNKYNVLFTGEFTYSGSTYHEIVAEYQQVKVRTSGNPTFYCVYTLRRIYYVNLLTDNTIDVVSGFNSIPGYSASYSQDWSNQFSTWAFVSTAVRNIHINYSYTGINSLYPMSFENYDTAILDVVFSNQINNYTLPDGTINGGNNIPSYDDVPTSYAFGSIFGLISMAFGALSNFLSINILPGVSLGTLFFIPLVVMIIIFIVWLVKR